MSKRKEEKASVGYLFNFAQSQREKLYGSVIFGILSGTALFIPFYAVYRVMLVLFGESKSNILLWSVITVVCILLRFLFHGLSGVLSQLYSL